MNKKTTCCNWDCPLIDGKCTFNIWTAHKNPAPCMKDKKGFGDYISQKQAIYKRHAKKEKKAGRKPMSHMAYFEEW